MTHSALDETVKVRHIRSLRADGLLAGDAYDTAMSWLRTPADWYAWTRRTLIVVGTALTLAGIVYFFAYNWADMGRFIKLGMIEASIVGCTAAAYLTRRRPLLSQASLISAAGLVGVFLGVYGQVYQTGADTYTLFAAWAVLIAGWVLIGQAVAFWLLWLVVVNTGFALFWAQVGQPALSMPLAQLCLVLAAVNGGALLLFELGVRRGIPWLQHGWMRTLLLAAMLGCLSFPTAIFLLAPAKHVWITTLAAISWVFVAATAQFVYRRRIPNMAALALVVSNEAALFLLFIGDKLFGRPGGWFDDWNLLYFAAMILGTTGGVVAWLRHAASRMEWERIRPT